MVPLHRFGAFNLLLRFYGAPWPRALLLSLPSTLLAVLLAALAPAFANTLFLHPNACKAQSPIREPRRHLVDHREGQGELYGVPGLESCATKASSCPVPCPLQTWRSGQL